MQKQRYTLSDVYNAAKRERHFNYAFWLHVTFDILGTHAMHGAGFVLVIFATVLITIISILGFLVVLPAIFTPGSFWMMVHNIWGVFAIFSIYFHYYMAVFTKPGTPRDGKDAGGADTYDALLEEGCCDQTLKLCKKCNYSKPKRTHHCSICNTCVLKMDHHCPWVSNCVGYRNYRYFFGFLFWATVGTMYVSALSGYMILTPGSLLFPSDGGPGIVTRLFGTREHNIYAILYDTLSGIPAKSEQMRIKKGLRGNVQHLGVRTDPMVESPTRRLFEADSLLEYTDLSLVGTSGRYLSDNSPKAAFEGSKDVFRSLETVTSLDWLDQDMLLFMAFMLSTGVWIGTGTMLMMHTFLVCNGYTTLEYFESDAIIKKCKEAGVRYKHPYDRGIRRNFEEVFGPYPWYLALLPSVRDPPVVVFDPMPDLFPPQHNASAAYKETYEENYPEEDSHGQRMFNSHSTVGASAGAPRWEHNTTDVEEQTEGLIADRPQDDHVSSGANDGPSSNQGVTPRSASTSTRKSSEQISSWNDKSK